MAQRPELKDEPYCGNCGYILTGAVESSKCPECGQPLVEVLTRNTAFPRQGKRYRSKATLFGLPVIDIAMGPAKGEMIGKAAGIIAIGDIAVGGVALGGMAFGVVAVGGVAVGLFAMGGLAIGLLTAIGGLAIGALATGGGAIGVLASGGGAMGIFAEGGGALGMFIRDASTKMRGSPGFETAVWFFGSVPTGMSLMRPMIIILAATLAVGGAIALIAWLRLLREPREADKPQP